MPSSRVVIDLDVPLSTISRHIYGQFAEHLGRCIYGGLYVGEDSDIPHVEGIRQDVVDALRALEVPNLRWPGGCFADYYHWEDGVGPKEHRPTIVNTHWGDVVENNHFGTHEFMRLCELLGAEPYVNGNLASGTPREMSEWVEYLTRPGDSPMAQLRKEHGRDEPWLVPFWGIGNEPWGCGGNMGAHHFAEEARRYSTFVRNFGKNRLYKIAAGAAVDDYRWTEELMKAATECLACRADPTRVFNGVSFHYYTWTGQRPDRGDATRFTLDEYYVTMARAQDMDRIIRGHVAVMDRYDPSGALGLVCDEWGTWWNVEEGTHPRFLFQQNALRDALVAAATFDIFHRHARRLTMANIAQVVNVLQAMVLTDDAGAMVLTPTYHVFEMNKRHQDATSVPTYAVERPPTRMVAGLPLETLSTSASVTEGRALVSVTNLDAEAPLDIVLDLRGGRVDGFSGRLLNAPTLQQHNTAEQPSVVTPGELTDLEHHDRGLRLVLPAHSFATVELTLG